LRILHAEELTVEEVVGRREMLVAVATEEITPAALYCDWLFAAEAARLSSDPSAIGGMVWRLGARAWRLWLAGGITAVDVADEIIPSADVAHRWAEGRSARALDVAAALIRRHGGDALERAEFARLFAAGVPQVGLEAFLKKHAPQW
jgi:hypothetical protein